MEKKIIIILIIIMLYFMPNRVLATQNSTDEKDEIISSQEKALGIGDFISEADKYTGNIDISQIFEETVSGKLDNTKIIKYIIAILGDNMKGAITMIAGIIVVVIIHSILKAISENLGNESIAKIAYYIQYILIITLVMKNFSDIITGIKTSIQNLSAFTNTLIPLLSTLMITTGNIVTSRMIEPMLLFLITFISNLIVNVIIPIILVATALGIISKISDEVQVDKLSKFFKKGSVWVLTTVLGLFMTLTTLEGGVTSGLDGVTLKAGKSIVSNAIPVVGGILGDAIDTVLGYSNIIKNAVGIVGIIVVMCICIQPILNLTALTITYYLGAALCQPIADEKIVRINRANGRNI